MSLICSQVTSNNSNFKEKYYYFATNKWQILTSHHIKCQIFFAEIKQRFCRIVAGKPDIHWFIVSILVFYFIFIYFLLNWIVKEFLFDLLKNSSKVPTSKKEHTNVTLGVKQQLLKQIRLFNAIGGTICI